MSEQMEQHNPTMVEHEYNASEIQVLEGLEAGPEASGHVYRIHLVLWSPSSGV